MDPIWQQFKKSQFLRIAAKKSLPSADESLACFRLRCLQGHRQPSAPSPKSLGLRCVQNGSSARREEGAYLDRYVTDDQRSSRPIFNATLWAAAGGLFFRVARSTAMIQRAALYRQSGSDRLEKQPTDLRRSPRDLGDDALEFRLCKNLTKKTTRFA